MSAPARPSTAPMYAVTPPTEPMQVIPPVPTRSALVVLAEIRAELAAHRAALAAVAGQAGVLAARLDAVLDAYHADAPTTVLQAVR